MYEPKHLKLWQFPDSYFGDTFYDYYPVVGQHRDSDALTRSNFRCILTALGGEVEGKVIVTHSRHWAVGWVEELMVHKDCEELVKQADEIVGKLKDYCCFNEDDFSELEYEEFVEAADSEFKSQLNDKAPEDWLHQLNHEDDIPRYGYSNFDYKEIESALKSRGWLNNEEG